MWKKFLCSWQFVIIVATIVIIVISVINNRNFSYVAENTLTNLLSYSTKTDVVQKLAIVKENTTQEVYDQLTSRKEDSLFNLIQTSGEYASVNIVKITESYIIYGVEHNLVSPDDRFIFCYDTDRFGKIICVREGKLDDFINFDESLY